MDGMLKYDYSFMMDSVVGEHGASDAELEELKGRLLSLRSEYFLNMSQTLGFMELPYDTQTCELVSSKAKTYSERFKTLIVLGIGGSDLGARAVISALRSPYANWQQSGMQVFFLGGNTDPCEISETLEMIDLSTTAINVISKSGDTVETMSTFIYLRDLLIKKVGYEEHKKHIIATTDAKAGTLHAIVEREGYDSLIVPDNVGGRFSVLSTVGLFPVACAGIDISLLLNGAKDMCESLLKGSSDSFHQTEVFAALHYLGYAKRGQNIHVLLPYSVHLRETGFWFRQLWAESLGKKDSLDGREVFVGPTPVAAYGATDQHSQFQLYYQGPYDKMFTFVEVEKFDYEVKIPAAFEDIEGISYMKDLDLGNILNAELRGSSLAMAERQRPNGRLILPSLTPYVLGQLFQFFEIATAYMGGLLSINTYDQPGVELGKHNVYALFGRSGYEERKKALNKLMEKYALRVV